VRPRSRSHDPALRTRNDNKEVKSEAPKPEITVSSPSPSEKNKSENDSKKPPSPTKVTNASRSSSPPKSPKPPSRKPSPRRRRPSAKGRGSPPIPTFDGGESLTGSSSEYEREEMMKMRKMLPPAEETPRVASALATLDDIEKKAAENQSWEDLSIVDKSVMEDLRDRVSKTIFFSHKKNCKT
jgi:hypothetical protein